MTLRVQLVPENEMASTMKTLHRNLVDDARIRAEPFATVPRARF